jgi:hypothetical protein
VITAVKFGREVFMQKRRMGAGDLIGVDGRRRRRRRRGGHENGV